MKSINSINDLNQYFKINGIDFELLSGFLKEEKEINNDVEIDLWICDLSKNKFLNTIYSLGFKERIERPNKPGCHFYILLHHQYSITLDVKYDLRYFEWPIRLWVPTNDIIKKRLTGLPFDNKKEKWMFRLLCYTAECAWVKGDNLSTKHVNNLNRYSDYILTKYNLSTDIVNNINNAVNNENGMHLSAVRNELENIIISEYNKSYTYKYLKNKISKKLKFGLGNKILFLGTDGVGKSTLIEKFSNTLPLKHTNLYLGMGDAGWKFKFVKKIRDIHHTPAGRRLGFYWLFWYLFFPIELIVRRLICAINGSNRLVLIDRFPGMPFRKGNILKFIYKLVLPRIDLVVLLVGDPQIISERKPEESSIDRVVYGNNKWRNVSKQLNAKETIELDTSTLSIEECRYNVFSKLSSNSSLIDQILKANY